VLAPSEAGDNDGYHFSPRERDSALAALRWMRRRFNVEEDRVFLTGVSRGGHLAWDLALRFPDRFAGLAPMLGGPRLATQDAQNNLRYLENVAHLSIRDLQGARDDPGLVFNVELAFERLARLAAPDARLYLQEEHGHSFDASAVDWARFFSSARRDPDPARVVRRATRADEARAFWAEIGAFERGVDETFRPRVEQARWTAMDDGQRRRLLADEADARTARLEVTRSEPGRFRARGEGLRHFRLLLAEGAFDPGEPVEVEFEGKTRRLRPRPSAEVLLAEFAERFDRRYLPLAELEIR
jgi:dienelactone hydrolase